MIFRVQKIEYYHKKKNQLKLVYGKVELNFFCQHRYNQRSLFENEKKWLTRTKKNIFDFRFCQKKSKWLINIKKRPRNDWSKEPKTNKLRAISKSTYLLIIFLCIYLIFECIFINL